MDRELQPYLAHLRDLPFTTGARVRPLKGSPTVDAELELSTRGGKHIFEMQVKKSHLSPELVERVIGTAGDKPTILLAPRVSRSLGNELEEAGVCFVDLAGNCYVDLDGKYVARFQGRRSEAKPTAQKAMRAPAYCALFALLARPDLVDVPIRTLAEAAGVSRQAASDIRARLVEMEILFKTPRGFGWVPGRAETALDMFVTGYATTLRPSLLIGRFRTPDGDPAATEERIAPILQKAGDWRWGGGSAADRMLRYYRGPNTVVHLGTPAPSLQRSLQAIPSHDGPLHLLELPGPLALDGTRPDTAHPLLAYAELLVEGGDRAREAAQQIAEKYLPSERYE